MQRIETRIPEVAILQSSVFRDARGYFQEIYNRKDLLAMGIEADWKQDNVSVSQRNVVRGLHYQIVEPQAKLVRVVHGAAFDVAVDIRRSSPTFGRHVSVVLKAGDGQAFLIPAGFAHGYAALEPDTTFLYKVDRYYAPQAERTILWNDPELGIPWPVMPDDAIVSAKDLLGKPFNAAELFP